MKKAIIAVLILVTALSFAGCQKNDKGGKVTFATDPTFPPFEMLDEETKAIVGLDIEVVDAIAKNQGLEIEYVNVGFDALVPAVAQCQYDAAVSGITITDERKEQMLFSDPYFVAGQRLAVKEGNEAWDSKEALQGKIVGGQTGTTGAFMAKDWEDEGFVTQKGYDYSDLAFMDLKNGQIDAVLIDDQVARSYAESLGGISVVGEMYSSEEYGIAVCKKNDELLGKINAGLKAIAEDGTLDAIIAKYSGEME